MKNLSVMLIILLASVACDRAAHTTQDSNAQPVNMEQAQPVTASASLDAGAITEAFGAQRNLPLVQGSGIVTKVLKDDNKGSQHQKFLLKVSEDITVLIAHNIELAPRVADVNEGDTMAFKGEYIYTPKGGTVHWTHKDPRGNHQGGWLRHNNKTYE